MWTKSEGWTWEEGGEGEGEGEGEEEGEEGEGEGRGRERKRGEGGRGPTSKEVKEGGKQLRGVWQLKSIFKNHQSKFINILDKYTTTIKTTKCVKFVITLFPDKGCGEVWQIANVDITYCYVWNTLWLLHTLSKLASCAPLCTVWLLRETLNCVAMVPGKIEGRPPGQLVFRKTLLCELMVHLQLVNGLC